MLLTINDKYRIKGDEKQWILEQRKRRVVDTSRTNPLKPGGETYSRWEAIGYFPKLQQAVAHLSELQLRISGAKNVIEALVESKRIMAELVAQLSPEFELSERKSGSSPL